MSSHPHIRICSAADEPASQGEQFGEVRRRTELLCEPLSAEDASAQSMTEASPAKWHLAHTSWFFETFVLEPEIRGYAAFHPGVRELFNSYYNSVGRQYPRPERGLLTRPSLDQVLDYRAHVDKHVQPLLQEPGRLSDTRAGVVEVGLHHEQQHQELILTDVKHLLSRNPLCPAYRDCPEVPDLDPGAFVWARFDAGLRWIGHDGPGFAFDNETPRHRAFAEAFEIASRPVTNREFVDFVEDRGYQRPELWLSDGWALVQSRGWRAPLYWEREGGAWYTRTLSGRSELRAFEPVCHLSFYEAEAFARWAGARLPSEAEWEIAASSAPEAGNFVESGLLHPAPSGAHPGSAPTQLLGDVWEWTRSPYTPYPGYRPPEGALGEYNGKFMSNQMVLRGGSCATPRSHIRTSYRNFFYLDARWQFSGVRLARDAA